MSLQHSALKLPEGGDEWTVDPAIAAGQTPIDDQQQTITEDAPAGEPATPVIQEPQTPQLSDLERVALGLGWTPKDQWRGDPNKWTDAASYITQTGRVLDRTKNDLKITRRMADEMNARLARLETNQNSAQEQRAQELFEQYEDAKFEAAKNGDTELYRKLTKEQQDVLAKVKPQPQNHQAPVNEAAVYAQAEAIMEDPVAARFFEANPIALHDEQAWALMDRHMTLAAQRGATPAQQFKAAEEALQYAYPQHYERPAFNGQIPANGAQHHSQAQPRAQDGTWTQANPQSQQQPQRRPAPPMNPASRVASTSSQPSAVERLPAEARDFLNKEIAAGRVKAEESEEWAKYFHGGPVVVRGRAMNGAKA